MQSAGIPGRSCPGPHAAGAASAAQHARWRQPQRLPPTVPAHHASRLPVGLAGFDGPGMTAMLSRQARRSLKQGSALVQAAAATPTVAAKAGHSAASLPAGRPQTGGSIAMRGRRQTLPAGRPAGAAQRSAARRIITGRPKQRRFCAAPAACRCFARLGVAHPPGRHRLEQPCLPQQLPVRSCGPSSRRSSPCLRTRGSAEGCWLPRHSSRPCQRGSSSRNSSKLWWIQP